MVYGRDTARPTVAPWLTSPLPAPAGSTLKDLQVQLSRCAHISHSGAARTACQPTSDPSITAGVCAFSLTSRITQRDGTTGRDAPGSRTLLYPCDPGPHRPAPPRRSRASGRLPEPRPTR